MNNQIYLVPGPILIPQTIKNVYQHDFGSADLSPEFLELYTATEKLWQQILKTKNQVVFMTGEGMLGLWAALKSTIQPGDRVLALANGIFGAGFSDMAKAIGAEVKVLEFPFDSAISDFTTIEKAILQFKPKMITAVHCETPSGILNSLAKIGELKQKHKVPLFCVDAVASIAGALVDTDAWHIDLCLGGGQKAPSVFPDMTFLSVSPQAWEIINQVKYVGYDALLPMQDALSNAYFPYTPHWHGIAALHESAKLLLAEGLENVFSRHARVANFCREQITALGLDLFSQDLASAAPTVTAVKIPQNIRWEKLNYELRHQGVIFGGSYGILTNKIMRIGHMGTQANIKLVQAAIDVLAIVLNNLQ